MTSTAPNPSHSLRPLHIKLSPLNLSLGSCLVEFDHTKVMAVVKGPQPARWNQEWEEEGRLGVKVRWAPWGREEEGGKGGKGEWMDEEEKGLASIVR